MMTSTIGQSNGTKRQDGEMSGHDVPSTRTVSKRLDRMVAILDGDVMRIHLGGEDRTGILMYVAQKVYQHGLNIEESLVGRLQRENTSTLLITGSRDRLHDLAEALENDKDQMLEGEVIVPDEIWDLTMMVPDRHGLIFDVSSILKGHKVNVKSMTSFVFKDKGGLDWACIKSRIEVGRENRPNRSNLEGEIIRKVRDPYESLLRGTPGNFNFDRWKIFLTERRHEHEFGGPWPKTGFDDVMN